MLTAREAVRLMSTRHGGAGGSIVTVSSIASRLGSPGEYVDYAASKGAVDSFTIGLAREVAGQGVRVNAVRPGVIDTGIHASGGQPDRAALVGPDAPMGRAGTADEVAGAITWLLSDQASYTTGAILDIGGGPVAVPIPPPRLDHNSKPTAPSARASAIRRARGPRSAPHTGQARSLITV